jgi:hypothetical protein
LGGSCGQVRAMRTAMSSAGREAGVASKMSQAWVRGSGVRVARGRPGKTAGPG